MGIGWLYIHNKILLSAVIAHLKVTLLSVSKSFVVNKNYFRMSSFLDNEQRKRSRADPGDQETDDDDIRITPPPSPSPSPPPTHSRSALI